MVELARCSRQHRIIIAGSRSPTLMIGLHQRGYYRDQADTKPHHILRVFAEMMLG